MVMEELFHRAGYAYVIGHCNFGLRGAESDMDEDFVRERARNRQVPFYSVRFDTRKYARKHRLSVQMAARELRYQWLEEVSEQQGFPFFATAHHLDDQAETFLINLARGTGIAGLHGILPKSGRLVRPLLFCGRRSINDFAVREGILYREDSSNRSIHYIRNRIRHKIIPQIEKINPAFRDELTRTIDQIRDAEAIYRDTVQRARHEVVKEADGITRIGIDSVMGLGGPVRSWIYELLAPYGFNGIQSSDILASVGGPSGKVFLSASHRLVIDREELLIQPLNEISAGDRPLSFQVTDREGKIGLPVSLQWKTLPASGFRLPESDKAACFDRDKIKGVLVIRRWQKGDRFRPLGMTQYRKLSDFFIDLKVSRPEKEKILLLCHEEEIIWVMGFRIDDRYKVTPDTREILYMEWMAP